METEQASSATPRRRKAPGRKKAAAGVKTSFTLSEEAVEAMHELASARQATFAEVIRRALVLDRYIQEASRNGRRILVEDPDKTLTQLVFF